MTQTGLSSQTKFSKEWIQLPEGAPVITPPAGATNADQPTVILNPFFRNSTSKISRYRFMAYLRVGDEKYSYLALALSKDGLEWLWWGKDGKPGTEAPAEVLKPEGGKPESPNAFNRLNTPHALFHNENIYLWNYWYDGSTLRICLATSKDGYTFSPNTVVLSPTGGTTNFDAKSVTAPSVLVENGVFKMWYAGGKTSQEFRLGLVEYTDPFKPPSKRTGPLFENLPSWAALRFGYPRIVRDDGRYLMFFCGVNEENTLKWQIGVAESADGLKWTPIGDQPILTKGEMGSWNEYSVYSPSILMRDVPRNEEASDSLQHIPARALLMYFGGINEVTQEEQEQGTDVLKAQTGVTWKDLSTF